MSENKKIYEKTALIAGDGRLPAEIARRLAVRDTPTVVYAMGEDNLSDFAALGLEVIPLRGAQAAKTMMSMKLKGVKRAILAGAVKKTIIYEPSMLDNFAKTVLKKLNKRDDHSILGSVVSSLELMGFTVEGYADIIPDLLAREGHMAGPAPTPELLLDIEYGKKITASLLPLSIGQTVAVKNLAVAAVEAMEGTDAALARAGALCRGAVAVKMMRKDQDIRYDMPTVGLRTLEVAHHAHFSCLALEAGRVIILDKEEFLSRADELSITIIGIA